MGTAKTEKELREETRARRARQDLKNTPLPIKSREDKKLFNEGARKREATKAVLNRLSSQRVLTGLSHSKSMTDLRPETRMDAMASSGRPASHSVSCENLLRYIGGGGRYKVSCQNLIDKYSTRSESLGVSPWKAGEYSKSCSNLQDLDWSSSQTSTGMRRSKSYSRITEEKSCYDQKKESYRSTIRNIYTNIKDFSSRTVSALSSSDRIAKASSLSRLSLPSSYPSTEHSLQRSSAQQTKDLSISNSMKSFRQLKLSTSFLSNSDSVSSYLGNSYKHFSNGFTSTSSASKSRPILSRGETIDSCCSEDLVTVLEVNKKEEKRPFKVIDRFRLFRKGIMAATLEDLIIKAKEKFEIDDWLEVYLVMEEDGTEVDDEEYFSTLSDNTVLMVLFKDDIWSPQGPAYTIRDIPTHHDEIQV